MGDHRSLPALKGECVEEEMPIPMANTVHLANGTNEVFSEEDYLTSSKRHRVDYSTATKLRVAAIVVSWISVVFAFTTGIAAVVFSTLEDSESLFGYGLDAILDGISSMVVLWRFYGADRSVYSAHRERVACIVISCLFMVAATCLFGKSIQALVEKSKEDPSDILYGLAICNGVVSLLLAITKVTLGHKLESKALITDSVITFTGFAVSVGTLISLVLTDTNKLLWYIDPILGILCATFLMAWGIKLLCELVCCYRHETQDEKS